MHILPGPPTTPIIISSLGTQKEHRGGNTLQTMVALERERLNTENWGRASISPSLQGSWALDPHAIITTLSRDEGIEKVFSKP